MTRARDTAGIIGSQRLSISINNNIGIGSTLPVSKLNVVGIVSATSFYGDGSNLSGISLEKYNELDDALFG
jgi:hypothetical protein